jgi:hypothetical protein
MATNISPARRSLFLLNGIFMSASIDVSRHDRAGRALDATPTTTDGIPSPRIDMSDVCSPVCAAGRKTALASYDSPNSMRALPPPPSRLLREADSHPTFRFRLRGCAVA